MIRGKYNGSLLMTLDGFEVSTEVGITKDGYCRGCNGPAQQIGDEWWHTEKACESWDEQAFTERPDPSETLR